MDGSFGKSLHRLSDSGLGSSHTKKEQSVRHFYPRSDNDGYSSFAEFARNTQVEDGNKKNLLRERHKSVVKKLTLDSNLHGRKHVLYEVCFNIFIPGFALHCHYCFFFFDISSGDSIVPLLNTHT